MLTGCVLKRAFCPVIISFGSCRSGKDHIQVPISTLVGGVSIRLGRAAGLLAVQPSAIRFVCAGKGTGGIPIGLRNGITLSHRCCVSSVVCSPSSIVICTPRRVLSAVATTCARTLGFRSITSAIHHEIGLTSMHKTGFVPSFSSIALLMSVCTRGDIRIPVHNVGFPPSGMLHAFPSGIRIAFRMNLDRFGSVASRSFFVKIACRSLLGGGKRGYPIGLGSVPQCIGRIHLGPGRISCLVRRQVGFGSWSDNCQ